MNNEIAVKVLFFGAARDAVGCGEVEVLLRGSQNAASAFAEVLERFPSLRRFGRSLLFAVNQEYTQAESTLEVRDGDELAVFPPVSGGSSKGNQTQRAGNANTGTANTGTAGVSPASTWNATEMDKQALDFFELTTDAIDIGAVARRVVLPECGATVTLDGYAREWTRGRRTLHLVYEAYAPMALSELARLCREAHEQFEIAYIGIVHRTGRLEIGDTSVVIAVGASHRGAAFEACEWAIRELKRTVPIWKKEIFEDGEVWVEGESSRSELDSERS